MIASKLKDRRAVLFASVCIVGAMTFLPTATGQPPVAERKNANAKSAVGKQNETDKDKRYQFAFFMLQAPAVLVSRPLHRLAARGGMVGNAAGHGMTILWMPVTSVLFFHGVNRVFPFVYASEPWLP